MAVYYCSHMTKEKNNRL